VVKIYLKNLCGIYNHFSLGIMNALSDISLNGRTDWKKDNYEKSIISPLPRRSWFDRFFCCLRRNKTYN
jgi:hypothetical protein